jgi:trk system potassium uptake protein TrkH
MMDIRPIAYLIGRMLIVLAILMLAPAIIDLRAGLSNGGDFLESAVITGGVGRGVDRPVHGEFSWAGP